MVTTDIINHIIINEEKHKLVHTIYRSLDRESNPRPLAYGNTASIEINELRLINFVVQATSI
jgi:hypothetical protein